MSKHTSPYTITLERRAKYCGTPQRNNERKRMTLVQRVIEPVHP